MVVARKAAVHTFRAQPAVELNRRALRNECGQVGPLAGLAWDALAPRTKIDDTLRGPEAFFYFPQTFFPLVLPWESTTAWRDLVEDEHGA